MSIVDFDVLTRCARGCATEAKVGRHAQNTIERYVRWLARAIETLAGVLLKIVLAFLAAAIAGVQSFRKKQS